MVAVLLFRHSRDFHVVPIHSHRIISNVENATFCRIPSHHLDGNGPRSRLGYAYLHRPTTLESGGSSDADALRLRRAGNFERPIAQC